MTILVLLAAVLLAFAISGGLTGAVRWSAHCGSAVVEHIWSPLLGDASAAAAARPSVACRHNRSAAAS